MLKRAGIRDTSIITDKGKKKGDEKRREWWCSGLGSNRMYMDYYVINLAPDLQRCTRTKKLREFHIAQGEISNMEANKYHMKCDELAKRLCEQSKEREFFVCT